MLSADSELLETAFGKFNELYFNNALPKTVITIQSSPKAYGHFTTQKVWRDSEGGYHEINIGAENLNRPIENVMATLLHEMVHLHCQVSHIDDTSKGGKYHNKHFKAEAEKRDLAIEYVQYHGYTKTSPTDKFIDVLKENGLYNAIERFRAGYNPFNGNSGNGDGGGTDGDDGENPKGTEKKKTSTRKYKCPACDVNIRATKEVNILCGNCMRTMEKVES